MSRDNFISEFKRISLNFPSNVAVYYVSETSSAPLAITYDELNRVTDELSRFFRRFFECRQYIAVRVTKSFWLFIIILSIWKSGNAFSGLAEDFSRGENKRFIEKLKIKYVITDCEIKNYKFIDEFWINNEKFYIWARDAEENGWGCDMCYGIMTSGSTGTPKVVQVPWSCILPNAEELKEIFKIDSKDNIYQSAPYTFDPFFIDLFLAFTTGASLTFVKYLTEDLLKVLFFGTEKKIKQELVEKNKNQFICNVTNFDYKRITIVQITSSLLLNWRMDNIQNILLNSNLRVLVLGGENFPNQIFHPRSSVKFYNIYGITEISCWAFIEEVKNNSETSIGKPLNGIVYKIENDELFVGSKHRKCLIDDDEYFKDEEILFRPTGDLVKIIHNQIYFSCRNNQIIKRLGVKIDLNKIEKEFLNKENVKDCRCLFDDLKNQLLLFLIFNRNQNRRILTSSEIFEKKLDEIISKLIDIEKPDRLIEIPSLPINSNGKCDTKQLLQISRDLSEDSNGDLKEKFYEIWRSVLNSEAENFKKAGGNSVLALLMTNQMDDANIKVPKNFLSVLFEDGDFASCLKLLEDDFAPRKKFKVDNENFHLDVLWKFDFKKCIDASPVAAEINGKWSAIVGSHSSLLSSVELGTGIENWRIKLGDGIESGCCINKNSTVGFIGCYDHFVYCISLSDGKMIWKYETGDMIKSTPCLSTEEETVFVASYDTYLYCLSFSDGTLLKKLKLSDKGIYCSGSVSHDLKKFYIGTLDGSCLSINQNTKQIDWENKLTSPIFASPCLHKELVIFIEVLGRVQSYSADTGIKVWTYESSGNVYSSPLIFHDLLMFGCHDRCLYCLKIEDAPSLKYRSEYDSPIFAAPRLIKIEDEILIVVVSTKGFVYLSNFDSGVTVSSYRLQGEVFSSPYYHENRLIIGCRDNYLYCLKCKR